MKFFFALTCLFLSLNTLSTEITTMAEWAKETPPNMKMSAAYMHIHNGLTKDIDLLSVTSTKVRTIEIHTHIKENGVMQMRQVKKLTIPKNGMIELAPGGNHLMLIGLKSPLKSGSKIDLSLKFSNGKKIELNIPVKPLSGSGHHHH